VPFPIGPFPLIPLTLAVLQPTNPGDPDQVFDEETTSFPYELELEEVGGHYFIAQYQVFTTDVPPIEEETVCSASGEEVLRFRTR